MIERPNPYGGQPYRFPDGTPEDVIQNAIASDAPEQEGQGQPAYNPPVDSYEGQEMPGQKSSGMFSPEQLEQQKNITGFQGMQMPDFSSPEELEKSRSAAMNVLPFVAPGLGSWIKGGGLAKIGARTLGEMGTQGGLAAWANPEDAKKAGGAAAATAGVTNPLVEALMSNNKYARMAKRAFAPIIGGLAGEKGAEYAGLSFPSRIIAGGLGAVLGHKGMQMMDKNYHMRPAAESYSQYTSPEVYEKGLREGKRHGYHMLPGEASGKMGDIRRDAQLGSSEEGGNLLQDFLKSRKGNEKNIIEKALEKISPERFNKLRSRKYDEMGKESISPKGFNTLYKNKKMHSDIYGGGSGRVEAKSPVIEDALNKVRDSKELKEKFSHLSEEQFSRSPEVLDAAKQKIDRRIDYLAGKKKLKSERMQAEKSRDVLSNVIKEDTKSGRLALNLGQRKIAKDTISKFFDSKEMSGKTLHDAMKSKKLRDKIGGMLVNAPMAKKNLSEIYELFGKTKNANVNDLAKVLPDSMAKGSPSKVMELATSMMKSLTSGKYDKAAVELATNPEFPKILSELKKITNKEKLAAKFVEVLGKGAGQGSAKALSGMFKEARESEKENK